MENKNVGWLIIGISAVIIGIIYLFNNAMKNIIMQGCPLFKEGIYCPALGTITQQTYLSLAIVGVLVIIGIILIFTKPLEKIIIKNIKEKKVEKKIDLSKFRPEEKQVFNTIKKHGAIFQADLIEKSGFGKAKISRIIDRLEGQGLVERKRRGMTNVVVLKD